ncbi:hypothetical protein C8P68_101239 [Mucilaginibacter yixingensis]|uniref:Uncharacterized protein n=1 Tax=Mucilaginibacter yixingensis TaxID=1295612 RepID=A0A2T5JF14_9SPHI|nr:hypothetical protein C8P68_101239 [Mucilaginibacter yixingensis]
MGGHAMTFGQACGGAALSYGGQRPRDSRHSAGAERLQIFKSVEAMGVILSSRIPVAGLRRRNNIISR